MQLVDGKARHCDHTESLDSSRVMLHCDLPLNEILVDFNDRIKSDHARLRPLDYERADYRVSPTW